MDPILSSNSLSLDKTSAEVMGRSYISFSFSSIGFINNIKKIDYKGANN